MKVLSNTSYSMILMFLKQHHPQWGARKTLDSGQHRAAFHQPQCRTGLDITQPGRYVTSSRSISPRVFMSAVGKEQISREGMGEAGWEHSRLCSSKAPF